MHQIRPKEDLSTRPIKGKYKFVNDYVVQLLIKIGPGYYEINQFFYLWKFGLPIVFKLYISSV